MCLRAKSRAQCVVNQWLLQLSKPVLITVVDYKPARPSTFTHTLHSRNMTIAWRQILCEDMSNLGLANADAKQAYTDE